MGKIWLRVQTVPALDPVTQQEHTAYSVTFNDGADLLFAPGWTLRDAIETFCNWFHMARENVCVLRPFFPQKLLNYE